MVKIYSVSNDAQPGDMPAEKLTLKETLPYETRTVGLTRYMAAKQDGVEIAKIIRCPLRSTVSPQDVAIPLVTGDGDTQYSIVQVQQPLDVTPNSMDLVLEAIVNPYTVDPEE